MKVFKETQRFTQLWLIVLMAVSLVVPFAIIIKEYNETNSSINTTQLLVSLTMIVLSGGIIFLFKLTTRIDEKGIHYQFFPFYLKMRLINWNEINKAYVRTYDPIGEFGGWGLKGGALWNRKKGRAINVSGDIGIQLELKNGKKLLIGTQRKEEAKNVLKNYRDKISEKNE